MKAKVRQELKNIGVVPPTSVGWLPENLMNETFICFQPEELQDEQFNTIVLTEDSNARGTRNVYLVISADFEFMN